MRPRIVEKDRLDSEPARRVPVRSVHGRDTVARDDLVAVEAPLEIRVALPGTDGPGEPVAVTMRTPGNDVQLALGFLHGEGLIRTRRDVAAARDCGPDGNVVRVELAAGCTSDPSRVQRNFYATSSCGVCGKASLAALEPMLERVTVDAGLRVDAALLASLDAKVREAQAIFRDTGGLHAASLFDAGGRFIASFEDVGRHNALDKLVGAMLLQDTLPLSSHVLHLSGRASFELVQKAAAAGIPVVAAVGAASSLAIDLAERAGILLVGFLRGDSFNVYAHGERLA
jgi:FdhD protein